MTFKKFNQWLTGKDPKQMTQQWIVRLRMVERRLNRQGQKMKRDEGKMLKEVKSSMESGDMETARLFAKDVARSRRMRIGTQKLASRIKAINFKLQQAQAVQTIGSDLTGLVRALKGVNQTLKIPEIEQTVMRMEYEMEKLDMTSESLEDGFESITYGGEEEDQEVDKILGELSAARAATADIGLPTPDIRSKALQKDLDELERGEQEK